MGLEKELKGTQTLIRLHPLPTITPLPTPFHRGRSKPKRESQTRPRKLNPSSTLSLTDENKYSNSSGSRSEDRQVSREKPSAKLQQTPKIVTPPIRNHRNTSISSPTSRKPAVSPAISPSDRSLHTYTHLPSIVELSRAFSIVLKYIAMFWSFNLSSKPIQSILLG